MRLRNFLATLALAGAVACSDDRTPTAPVTENEAPNFVQAGPTQTGPLVIEDVTGSLQGGGSFVGDLTITQITRDAEGNLLATGTLVGTATQGTTVTQITQNFVGAALDLAQQGQRCQILFLDLGPIFLDLLGLQVDLSQITLDITAVAGAGNLLGNLLCAIVGLLDRTPLNLTALDQLLTQINDILGGLLG